MAINLMPHPQDAPAIHGAPQATASPAPHILIGSAIMLVAIALALLVSVQVGAPAGVGIAAGVAFAIGAGWLHLRIVSPSQLDRTVVRNTPTLDTPVKRSKKRAKSEAAGPELSVEPNSAMAEAAPQAILAGTDPQPDRVVEPSDLALALLASLRAPDASPAASDSWNRAIAAHLEQPRAQAAHADQAMPPPIVTAPLEAETEVQRVERLVKRLADNVNQLQAMRDAHPESSRVAVPVAASTPMTYDYPELLPLFPEPGDDAGQLEASINALRRANAAVPVVPPVAPVAAAFEVADHWTATPAPVIDPHASSQRNSILSALNEQRIDVYLEPILDLADQRPQHYEVSIALRTYGGHTIDLTQAANDLSGTGLLPLIDQARIARAANLARRLADRGKTGAVFAELNGETLDDGGFQDTFANDTISVGAFPGQLVLTLPQAHVATFTAADWHTLARLREAGFGFALSDVTTLDMDFARLAQTGFVFARLDAETFLIGLPTSGMIVPPADICRHLAECGLMLIVGGIVEDHQLARIFGFGVLFGQGQLFGGARPMKSEAASASATRTSEAPALHA